MGTETGGLARDVDFSLMPGLLPAAVRDEVRAFGRFVRIADDIVDNFGLSREEKFARLNDLERALKGEWVLGWSEAALETVRTLADAAAQRGTSTKHAEHVLQAFKRDVAETPIRTWAELLVYCQFAAAPIGRFMLELLAEDLSVCGRRADALCAALRILKRLRDCKDPTAQYQRLCIPERFLTDAFITPDHLKAPTAKGQTRAVIDRVLDGVDRLLAEATPLPKLIRSQGLALHAAIVLCRARKLAELFRIRDPLSEKVHLAPLTRYICKVRAVAGIFLNRL